MSRTRALPAFGVLILSSAFGCGSSLVGDPAGKGGAGAGPIGGAGGTGGAGAIGGDGGTGGAGAGAIGGAGGTADPNVCGVRDAFGTHLRVSGADISDGPRDMYDGPAAVERSTNDDLLLAYTAPQTTGTDAGGADPDAAAQPATPLSHAVITGLEPMPLFPLGAKVWLSVYFVNIAGINTLIRTNPWSIEVRDREGGVLLFGAALNPWDGGPRSPVPISAPAADCTIGDYKPQCSQNTGTGTWTMTYQSVTMQGDTSVVLHDSQPGKVSLGGIDYDVRLTARKLGGNCYLNLSPNEDGIALDIQASDLPSRVAGLDIGTPP
jgi:hypothetical protein